MALPPTGSGPGSLRERAGLPAGRSPTTPAGRAAPQSAPAPAARPAAAPASSDPSKPAKGRRLRTAMTDADIDRQIRRLMSLIANDNIDPNAPPGSYLNILL